MDTLDIAEVARRTGLTARALRFYEARGLVTPLRTGSGRRCFGPGELARLHAIVALKRAGFTLAQIARLLAGRETDLARLVAAQIAELNTRAAELTETRTLLSHILSRIDRGEPIPVATLCSLISKGNTMEHENWKAISDRYLSDDAKAYAAQALDKMPKDFDQAAYSAKWADLTDRIEAALPMNPTSPEATAFHAEWIALLAPFTAVASPAMMQGVGKMYDGMHNWQGRAEAAFLARSMGFHQIGRPGPGSAGLNARAAMGSTYRRATSHASHSQPPINSAPPTGVTAPSQRGSPIAMRYRLIPKIAPPATNSQAAPRASSCTAASAASTCTI